MRKSTPKLFKAALAVALLLCAGLVAAPTPKPIYQCAFGNGQWNIDDWTKVKSPRWDNIGDWVQNPDHIVNVTPKEASPEELQGTRAPETYTSMLFKQKLKGKFTVYATMSFEYHMAPLVVLASELGQDTRGNYEYREHWEVVLFDEGVNIWHHSFQDGKPSWKKAAYFKFPLEPGKKYTLKVAKSDANIEVTVDGHVFGYRDETLPNELYAGVTACEGVNRFYDFKLEQN